jgi:hypothetical protein
MPTSHIIENPYGRIFAHGLTGGNVMLLIVDHAGKNLSVPLSAEESMELGRWLFFNHQDGLAVTVVEAKQQDDEDDELWQVTPAGAAAAAREATEAQVAAYRRPPAIELPARGSERWHEIARLFMSDEAGSYRSPTTGHKGRTGFVADTLNLTSKQAGNLVTRAREAGAIPDSFSARSGEGGRAQSAPPVWSDERLKELAAYYTSDEAADYVGELGRGRIPYTAAKMGIGYNSVNRAIQKARAKGFIKVRFQKGAKPRTQTRKSVTWDATNLGIVVSLFNDPASMEYVAKNGRNYGRTARVADYFGVRIGTATMAIRKAREKGMFPAPPPAEDLFALANGSLEPASA